MNEYVIWGKVPGNEHEDLLLTRWSGKYITDKKLAETLADIFRDKGFGGVRVQTIEGKKPDFVGAINLSA